MRTSPTRLVATRLFKTEDWMTPKRFIEQMTGEFKGNRKTDVGSAIHSIIEHQFCGSGFTFEYEGVIFETKAVEKMLEDLCARDVCGIPEAWGTMDIDTIYGSIKLNGRCDNVSGLTVRDYKSSEREFDIISHFMSPQWKCYLAMFQAEVFRYEFIRVFDPESLVSQRDMDLPVVVDYDGYLKLYTYDGLMNDLRIACTDYIELVRRLRIPEVLD